LPAAAASDVTHFQEKAVSHVPLRLSIHLVPARDYQPRFFENDVVKQVNDE
jgi:hypothetical protein